MTLPSEDQTLPGFISDALGRVGSLLDTLFETSEDAVFVMDGIRFVDCNPRTLRMFGCSRKGEIVGKTPFRFSPARQPDGQSSAEKAARLVAAAMDSGHQQFEWRHSRLDGSEFDVEVRLNRFSVGDTPFLIAVVRDITARKRAERILRRQVAAEELINGILSRCAECTPALFDKYMTEVLKELAAFFEVDHAYFFLSSADGKTYTCTHETAGPGVTPLRSRFQNVGRGTSAWIERSLLKGETVRLSAECDFPEDAGCRSVLQVPTTGISGAFVGVLGVDSHLREISWSDSDVRLCSIVGKAVAGMIERREAAEKLLREKQFSDRLIESLPGIFYGFDADLRLRLWNRNQESFGYGQEELIGKPLDEFLPNEEARNQVRMAAEGVLSGNKKTDFIETEIRRKDGSVVPFLFTGARIDAPRGPMIIGVGVNITALKEAEEALADSERRLRELFNATTEALIIFDESTHIREFNAAARTMFGFGPDDDGNLTIWSLSLNEPPYTQEEAAKKIRAALEQGPQTFDWRCKRRDGSGFWAEIALRAFESSRGRRFLASMRDGTERQRAVQERERLMAEVQAASAAKDQFLAVLSHELRNPLAAIQASAALLRRLPSANQPSLERAVEIIERNVRLQARFVNDLLDLSRITRGKLAIQRAPVRLDETVQAAVQACQTDATRAGVTLEMEMDPDLWVDADGDRIQQIVLNLVGNGIKFTPKSGSVRIEVKAQNGQGRITVADSGVGIEPDRMKDLFQMFRQGEIAAQRAPGLGIGLALVRSLVELHGGRVWAESAGTGQGSRFIVELPLRPAPTAVPGGPHAPEQRAPMKVLLLEDNNDTRTMLAETLAQFACQVLPAESGEAALNILQHENVDAILADIGLPGMDGYEFLQRARRLPSAARAPAFAVTGYGQAADVQRAHEAGFQGHFVKPLDVDEIYGRLRASVAQPQV